MFRNADKLARCKAVHRMLAVFGALLLLIAAAPARPAQGQEVTVAATGFIFTSLQTAGTNGFTQVYSVDGTEGTTAFYGTRNGVASLWVLRGGVISNVLPEGGVLPGGLGTVTVVGTFRVAASGDVLFKAAVSGGTLTPGSYTFRWRNGSVILAAPTDPSFSHRIDNPNLASPISDGRWLVVQESGVFPRKNRAYFLTDGETVTPIVTLTDTAVDGTTPSGFSGWCTRVQRDLIGVNANGVYAFSEFAFENDPCAANPLAPQRLTNWSLKLGGAEEATLISGSYTQPTPAGVTGIQPLLMNAILSDANELLFVRNTRNPSATPKDHFVVVTVNQAGTVRELFDSQAAPDALLAEVFVGLVTYLDAQGRIATNGRLGNTGGPRALLKGNNFATDVFLKEGDPLFGSTLALLQPMISVHTRGAGGARVFLFTYQLANGEQGIAQATSPSPRWTNAAGGAWSTSANWDPDTVPSAGDDTIFAIAGTYDVQVGPQAVASVTIEQGSPGFRNGDLTIGGNLRVGNGATLTLPEGSLLATETQLGHLAPANPVAPLTAHLNLFNSGTSFTSTVLSVGAAAPAELFISNGAHVSTTLATVGDGGPGSVIVGGTESRWTTDSLRLGSTFAGQLRVENSAFVSHDGAVVIGGTAATAAEPGTEASVTIRHSNPATLDVSLWRTGGELLIGQGMLGSVIAEPGGQLLALDLVTVGAGQPGYLYLDGGGLEALRDLIVGSLSEGLMRVGFGGFANVTGSLILGVDEGATLLVLGKSSISNEKSTVYVDTLPGGLCRFGVTSAVEVFIVDGGLVTCKRVEVGVVLNSEAMLYLGNASGPGTLQGDTITVGGSGAGNDGRGNIEMNGGLLQADSTLLVSALGQITGTGTIEAGQSVVNAGQINVEGGIRITSPKINVPVAAAGATFAAQTETTGAFQSGTLTVTAPLTLAAGSRLLLDLGGSSSAQQDRLLVQGSVILGGELVLRFTNGYVPQAGDTFAFLQATSVAGTFDDVTVVGLPPQLRASFSVVGGQVQIAISETTPNPPPAAPRIYLPTVRK